MKPPSDLTGGTAAGADWRFEALGTRWEITTAAPLTGAVRDRIAAELTRIDEFWSRFRADSVISRLARDGGEVRLADSDRPLWQWYRRLYEETGGAVTPTVGQTLVDAGYDAEYSLVAAETVRAAPPWAEVFDDDGGDDRLRLRKPTLIDVGAAGKGFAVDRVAAILDEVGDGYLVDAGGDMRIRNHLPLRIALEHPLDPARAIGVAEIASGAICASAPNRRAWADWHHIVDPHLGSPAREVLATWVIVTEPPDRSAMIADGLATALFFSPAPALRARHDFHHVTVRRNGSIEHTDLPGLELFL